MTKAQKIFLATYKACDFMYDHIMSLTDGETVIGLDSVESEGYEISDALLNVVASELHGAELMLDFAAKDGTIDAAEEGRARMVYAMVGATIDNTRKALHRPLGMGWGHAE